MIIYQKFQKCNNSGQMANRLSVPKSFPLWHWIFGRKNLQSLWKNAKQKLVHRTRLNSQSLLMQQNAYTKSSEIWRFYLQRISRWLIPKIQFSFGLNSERASLLRNLRNNLPRFKTLQTFPSRFLHPYSSFSAFMCLSQLYAEHINTNMLKENVFATHRRCFTSDINSTLKSQISNVFSQTNKQRVIKYVQGMRLDPALTQGCKRHAGVLVPFCVVDRKPSVLFTVRSSNLFTNRGDVSFPGGMKDQQDTDLIQTAVRETEEELGLPRASVEVWATLPQIPDRLGKTAITPVLGFIQDLDVSSLQLNSSEVDSVFILSMEHLMNPNNQRYTRFKSGVVYPAFVNGPARVWGLTAIILDRTLAILFPDIHKIIFRFPKRMKKDIKEVP